MSEMDFIDIRIADYLDDKLQTIEDFADLNSLIAGVELQRNQLQEQLDVTITDLDKARDAQKAAAADLDDRIAEFQALQASIDKRVAATATTVAPTVAIQRLQQPLNKIQNIDTAIEYLKTLQDAYSLKDQALSFVAENPAAAVRPAKALTVLGKKLREAHKAADEAAGHLVAQIEQLAAETQTEMRRVLTRQFEDILRAHRWPQVELMSEMDDEWLLCFNKVMDLDMPVITEKAAKSEPAIPLLPIEVMAGTFVVEFRYHFLADRKTSEPEVTVALCFKWFLDTMEKWEDYFRENLGRLMAFKMKGTPAANNLSYVDPVCALLTALLPVMLEKVRRTLTQKATDAAFISSFMTSLMDFDDQVKTRFSYQDGSAGGWGGLTSIILEDWFPIWFDTEKEFAEKRLQTILAAPDARTIDYDYGNDRKTKPTKGAVRVTDLLKSITGQYKRIKKFRYCLKFLVHIQIDILDHYHDYLKDGLQTYQTITSAVGRTLHGVSKEDQLALKGTGGIESLCKIYGSADHVILNMQAWSYDAFFVVLWGGLFERVKGGEHKRVTSTMTMDQVKNRISGAVESESEKSDGSLFDEAISAFKGVRAQAQDLLVNAVVDSHNKALKPYLADTDWTRSIRDLDDSIAAATDELSELLSILSRNLEFLGKILGHADYRRVMRLVINKLQTSLWNGVLMHSYFTAWGAAQFQRDVNAVVAVLERKIPNSLTALGSLTDGLQLLNLPVEATDGPTYRVVTDRVFQDNTEAKNVLKELGLLDLSNANARDILRRRVEFET